jgi:hypothetical protein
LDDSSFGQHPEDTVVSRCAQNLQFREVGYRRIRAVKRHLAEYDFSGTNGGFSGRGLMGIL